MHRHLHWLRKRRFWLQWISISLPGIGILIVLAGGYAFRWSWTGFDKKTFWDWMQLLIVPAALAIASFLFARAEHRREKAAEQQKTEAERQESEQKTQWERHFAQQQAIIERSLTKWRLETEMKQKEEFQRETLLQAYFDRMEILLVEKALRRSELGDEVRMIARVRTLTTLQRLDLERKTEVFWFLYESCLLGDQNGERIVDVSDADWNSINLNGAHLEQIDLRDINLSHAYLRDADLAGANLEDAILCQADLQGANLRGAKMQNADLTHANLMGADLAGADLQGATVYHANLVGADLKGTKLCGADLKETNLKDANLRSSQLNDADLTGANMMGADLTSANLQRADLSQANLSQAILQKSTLRDALLQRANLSRANLQGAYCTEEQLRTASSYWSIVR